ncbi:bifunctional DNA primase/polymerase [Kitasatospora sp. NPDC101183]|uniref:bifunctional DNA primase/polymerase n=1 Tax=Kitasatospora sp. NPDC101183 TaxID=3364100 RepID=UPI00383089CD
MTTPTTSLCERCEQPLSVMARRHARYCSAACKQAAYRARKTSAVASPALPDELTTRARWVRYSSAKVPLTPAGRAASSTDPATWSAHEEATASTTGVGLGFVLSDADDIVCIDLDHCIRPDGSLEPWAASIVADVGTTYVEVSPSGTGLHIWGRADVRQGRRIRRPDGAAVEVYGTGRYITVTGRRHGECPSTLADLSPLVLLLTR